MAKKNYITTVDIGTNSIKVMELEVTEAGAVVTGTAMEDIPRESATEKVPNAVITDILLKLIHSSGFNTKPGAISIPRQYVTIKGLSNLPASASDEDVKKMVPMQVGPELPFPIEQSIYSVYNIQHSKEGTSLEVVAAKRSLVQSYVEIAESVGLGLSAVIPSAFATYAAAFNQFKDQLIGKTLILADIGAGMTDICIIQHGRLAFSRSFSLGGNNLTGLFQKHYGVDFLQAEELKIREADFNSESTGEITQQWGKNLANEIELSIRAFVGERAKANIDALWLSGGSSVIPGLGDFLSNQTGVEIGIWNPMHGLTGDLPDSNTQSRMSVALGLGLISTSKDAKAMTVNANLLPKEIMEREEKARRKFTITAATIITIMVFLAAALGVVGWRRARNARIEKLTAKVQQMEQQKRTKTAMASLQKSILTHQIMAPYLTPLEVLREMSNGLPDRKKIALTSFNMDKKGRLTINVEANSHSDITETIQILSEMKLMDKVDLFKDIDHGAISKVTKDKRPVLQVQIVCALNSDAMQEVN